MANNYFLGNLDFVCPKCNSITTYPNILINLPDNKHGDPFNFTCGNCGLKVSRFPVKSTQFKIRSLMLVFFIIFMYFGLAYGAFILINKFPNFMWQSFWLQLVAIILFLTPIFLITNTIGNYFLRKNLQDLLDESFRIGKFVDEPESSKQKLMALFKKQQYLNKN